jgi:hypothetical protein
MVAIAFILVAVAVCILGAVYGRDSRFDEPGHHRANL